MGDHAANSVVVETNIDDEESIDNFVTTNLISPDSTVTCGKCKESMTFEKYESIHRGNHYNLCWLDGVENEIDFTDSYKIQAILQENTNKCKTKLKFKCDWCKQNELTIAGFTKHLKKCVNNPLLCVKTPSLESSKMNSSTPITHNDNSTVSCGRCGDNMTYTDYRNIHRHIHNNLCWLEGEDQLNYSNVDKTVALLREILPKYAERDKKVSFKCEWCDTIKKSVIGYARHVKNCAIEQKPILPQSDEPKNDKSIISNSLVNCACCEKSMLKTEYEKTHKLIHYNLCWLNGEEKLDLDNENLTQRLLRQSLPKDATKKKKVKFVCEWCQTLKKSILGFASHIKQCQLRPDKVALLNENGRINDSIKSDIEISKERDASLVTCGRCNNEMTFKEYRTDHCSAHYNLCWMVGEEKLDLENFDSVLNTLKKFIPFKAVRNRLVKLTCEDCKSVKKSLSGFASHVIFCNKTANDIKLLLLKCEDCGNKIKPSSLVSHKLKCCRANGGDFINNSTRIEPSVSSYKMRRKRRPPNILTLHPDTKYITEYYDCVCQLCDFITSSVNDIIDHILIIHDINIKTIDNKQSLDNFISITYDVHSNIYLKPLLNYYNFYKKTFWTATCHEDFYSDTSLLTSDVALKYFPSVQQSCKVFNSVGEEMCVDLFKSAYVNGMYWLFTGGPNWAMSWCPVPEQIKTQYLAISCHPKPDMEHKEMDIYKYPSLLQLWKFNYLDNINFESINDMPYMSYGLAHEFGAVWDMAWCPSGAYEPKKKIGLLALSTSCGDCPIFAMPYVDGNSETFFIYKTKPMIARNFECEWIENGVQCTKVCWQAVLPFKTLVCGYSNGNVSVFNINFQSIFLNDDILFPSHTFKAARSSITGLSMNYLNSSILATAATDGNIILWDLKSSENPVFHRKSYSPSDCNWLQQCYTLVYCSKGVNPLFLKVRTINFSNCDDDVHDYNPELYILKNVSNNSKEVGTFDDKKLNHNADEIINENKINKKNKKSTAHNDSDVNSDDESFKYDELSTNSDDENSINAMKSGEALKNIEDEDLYGPMFFQKSTHWSVSGSDWMNVIATGDENGIIYEKLFLPETNQIKKGNSTTLQLIVKKLSNDTTQSEYSNGYYFHETIKEFALESKFFPCELDVKNKPDKSKPLLRYPLDNIIKVSWNQNFNSFRWLGIGTQSGFTLVSPSRVLPNNCFESFYKKISNSNCNNETR